jgi:hypothetical protein
MTAADFTSTQIVPSPNIRFSWLTGQCHVVEVEPGIDKALRQIRWAHHLFSTIMAPIGFPDRQNCPTISRVAGDIDAGQRLFRQDDRPGPAGPGEADKSPEVTAILRCLPVAPLRIRHSRES